MVTSALASIPTRLWFLQSTLQIACIIVLCILAHLFRFWWLNAFCTHDKLLLSLDQVILKLLKWELLLERIFHGLWLLVPAKCPSALSMEISWWKIEDYVVQSRIPWYCPVLETTYALYKSISSVLHFRMICLPLGHWYASSYSVTYVGGIGWI